MMAQGLIWIKSENDRNFEVICQNRLKLGSRIKLDEFKPLFTLSVECLHHVTCYHCFFMQKENLKWVAEIAYDGYKLIR